jgi:hypothetical protein
MLKVATLVRHVSHSLPIWQEVKSFITKSSFGSDFVFNFIMVEYRGYKPWLHTVKTDWLKYFNHVIQPQTSTTILSIVVEYPG